MSKIAVVEDNENIKNELIDFLQAYGYEAFGVDDFKNVVQDILKNEPDLVLLDINLPYCDGYFICRELRKRKTIYL